MASPSSGAQAPIESIHDEDDDLPALFRDDLPDKLSNDLLALAHLSDVEETAKEQSGPIRKTRAKNRANPYKKKTAKTEEEQFADEMKELDFRARAWKPFRTVSKPG
jgi:hypothetical protein